MTTEENRKKAQELIAIAAGMAPGREDAKIREAERLSGRGTADAKAKSLSR